jgi:hypothetical protein
VVSFPFYITQEQSDALGRPMINVWASTLFGPTIAGNVLTINSVDGTPTYIMYAACPSGVDVDRSFECIWRTSQIRLRDASQGGF